ncbi:MAG: magnesium transporter CorA family protein [Prolixibacteraceae bacterium]|nr:magnesium transporter CorA family protein [Prolixibacteraceae bacterium]
MLKIFKSFGGFREILQAEKGCWINVIQPTSEEIDRLKNEFKIPSDIIRDILDADERPRYEIDDDWTLILFRIPIETPNNGIPYSTIPLGTIRINGITITLCSKINEILPLSQPALFKVTAPNAHYDPLIFIIKLFLRSGTVYLNYLKYINQQTTHIENEVEKSVRNKELNKLLKMEKCLVYFITSLKSNEVVLTKIKNTLKNMEEDTQDLLDDAIIENKQALEMAQIYSNIQSGMMDAFASVISNNLNVVMKQLTSISIILMIPTLIASLYGMNVPNFLENKNWAFVGIIFLCILMATMGIIFFRKKDMF